MAESTVEMGYGLLHELEKNCADAASVSDATLKMLIKDNQNTEYGQKYGFSHIGSVAEYKEQVPFTTYDDYAEYVSRMVEGEDDVLTSYPTSFFALTTGSVGVSKKIPVSDRAAIPTYKTMNKLITEKLDILIGEQVKEKRKNL